MPNLASVLDRSENLDEAVYAILGPDSYELVNDSDRLEIALAACELSIDHARALRLLARAGLHASALSLMRSQFESVVRAMWLVWSASDQQVDKLAAPLSPDSEKLANKLPMLSEMIAALDGKAPVAAADMVTQFKEIQAPALNSFVHGGIHPLQRHTTGYPEYLIVQVVSSSNALVTMAGMVMALLSGDTDCASRMSKIQRDFADCLPVLLPHARSS